MKMAEVRDTVVSILNDGNGVGMALAFEARAGSRLDDIILEMVDGTQIILRVTDVRDG